MDRAPNACRDLKIQGLGGRAIEANPRHATSYTTRAFARMKLGDAAGASGDFERAMDIDPTDEGPPPRALDLPPRLRRGVFIHVKDRDVGPRTGKLQRDGLPDPPPASRDNGDLALQHHLVFTDQSRPLRAEVLLGAVGRGRDGTGIETVCDCES